MELLTVREVAEQTNLTEGSIRNLIARGKIKATRKIGKNSMFTPDVVQIINARNRIPGKPKKEKVTP